MTIEGSRITALTWDCVIRTAAEEQPVHERRVCDDGDGPKWMSRQAVVKYVLENQSLDHLIDADQLYRHGGVWH